MFDGSAAIDVEVLGPTDEEEPSLAVVGGIHGDEPAGVRAIRQVLEEPPDLQRPVKLVLANPPATAAHRRYLDTDMNRSFPGSTDADAREERLAAELASELADCTTLSIHTTHSHDEPIALVDRDNPRAQEVADALPVEHVVDEQQAADGAFTGCEGVVSVEAGRQLSENATENAVSLVRAFLQLTDARPGEPDTVDSSFYSLREAVEKPVDGEAAELVVDNFEQVEGGETYARADGTELVTEEPFVPILMSECGYDDIFGYRGEHVGDDLESARETWGVSVEA
ncbi:succinylglutamate desuccinylase/aspartoacylase domain-containing protein [Haloarchaeobius amylolyticus]|uniref:succinylglutamate desuccinylase/aspartoacylase domain-containing protein n=1 Tax=Haloarchaeobius amylolyticus TaxID=1198296 RepID=UPI00226D75CF|nr:succinylglutamate desuccinylase/aspartoacylase family protein [Haloarchaeobius amylolyticus]